MKTVALRRATDKISELATRLPWWGGLLSALAVYTLLHPIAVLQMPTPTGTVDVVGNALVQLFVVLARIGQYLLPVAFLLAAVVSAFSRWKRGELRNSVAHDTSGSILRGLPRSDFELLVSDTFRSQGYEVSAPRTCSRAREKALELTRKGRRFLVDCTDWRSSSAGAAAVRGLHEHMQASDATGGFAVTSGQFTPEAMHFAAGKDIELIDGRGLKRLVRAEPQRSQDDARSILATLGSGLARGKKSSATDHQPRKEKVDIREAHIQANADPISEAGVRAVHIGTGEVHGTVDPAEVTAGQQLTALIRAERRIDSEIRLSAPPVHSRRVNSSRPRMNLPRFHARKIADAFGMLVAVAFLWSIYAWFLQLPDSPSATPWDLLGSGSDSVVLARRLQGLGRTRSAAEILKGERPLGQYQFGPPPIFFILPDPNMPAPEIRHLSQEPEEPVEVYHSLQELEAAFDAKYVPPPECFANGSSNLFVKCGNHRIRARRTFIANGGKITPTLLGSWEDPRAVLVEVRPQDWRQSDPIEWEREDNQGASRPWDEEDSLETDRYLHPEETSEPTRFEQQEDIAQDARRGWQLDQRQESWLDPPRVQAGKSEPELQRDWRQEWLRGPPPGSEGEWRQERAWQPTRDPARQRRRDWPRDGAEDRPPDWRSEPAPVEHRHWVDDL